MNNHLLWYYNDLTSLFFTFENIYTCRLLHDELLATDKTICMKREEAEQS